MITRKPVAWLGDSLDAIREFPEIARQRAGRQLAKVQDGLEPDSWKAMPSVGIGVNEIRIREGGAFRVIYVAKFPEADYVLHVFQKKTRKTSKADIKVARTRYRAMLNERKG